MKKRHRAKRPDSLERIGYDAAYCGLLGLASPIVLARMLKGKYRTGWPQKAGFVPDRPAGERIWIHAVSVGEAVAAHTLSEALTRRLPGHEVVVSTTTPTGQEVAARRFGAGNAFYLPLDFSGPVRRTFARVKPSALVLMELELWPNLIARANAAGVPVVVVNGRISADSLPRYRRVKRLLFKTMQRIDAFGVQTEEYAERFIEIGAPPERVTVTGSIKYDAVKTADDAESARWARECLALPEGAKLLLGGSTHRTEELALARAWRKAERTDWRLVVAPRHPPRVPEAEASLREAGFRTVRRTALDGQPLDADVVVIVDTVGELGRLYHAADLVFVGGSLIPHGGQNPVEPAGIGKAVIYGPHMFNFADSIDALSDARGAVQVADENALAEAVARLAGDADARRALGEAGRMAILARQGASALSAELIGNALARKTLPS